MITKVLKSPSNLYLEAKNQNISRGGGYLYNVTLSYNIKCYFDFWLIIRDDNAVLVSLITKKNVYWAIMEANFMLFYLQSVVNSHSIQ